MANQYVRRVETEQVANQKDRKEERLVSEAPETAVAKLPKKGCHEKLVVVERTDSMDLWGLPETVVL